MAIVYVVKSKRGEDTIIDGWTHKIKCPVCWHYCNHIKSYEEDDTLTKHGTIRILCFCETDEQHEFYLDIGSDGGEIYLRTVKKEEENNG
jgi:hypothetical protein